MTASNHMAKPITPHGVTLTYPATTAYKQWVWKEIRRRGWTQQRLVDEMKERCKPFLMSIVVNSKGQTIFETISTSTITNLLGPEKPPTPPPPSNCSFMPAINKVLGIPPPPVCDPSSELSQLVDAFRAKWDQLTPSERAVLIAVLRPPA